MLVLPLPLYRVGRSCFLDAQAQNGIHRWLDNFDKLFYCLPVIDVGAAPKNCILLNEAAFGGRLTVFPLPNHRDALGFAKVLPATVRKLSELIDRSTHRSFAIGGLFGDWAAVAGLLASRKNKEFSVWTDRVESAVTRFHASHSKGAKRLYWSSVAFAMKHYERLVIARASVALFHGADCYAAYARFNRSSHIVHNIHLSESARIDPAELELKKNRGEGPIRIVYAGRVHADKGVLDWIETLATLQSDTIDFVAVWHGDGEVLEIARAAVTAAGLTDRVTFPGALQDREMVMRHIRDADIFMFCHKTPESPRCLIEALISGTPIVGYGSDYSRDLIAEHGGGVLTEPSPRALAAAMIKLCRDRKQLGTVMVDAAASGYEMTDVSVFKHRSDLIKAASVHRLQLEL